MNEDRYSNDIVCAVDSDAGEYRTLFARLNENLLVEVAANGREALRLAAARPPTLWLINVKLPDMSGSDLVDMLRQVTACATVCLVGDHYHAEEERLAHRCGAQAYLCKPLDPAWMLQLLRRATSLHSRASPRLPPWATVSEERQCAACLEDSPSPGPGT